MSVIFTGEACIPSLSESQLMHAGCVIVNFQMLYRDFILFFFLLFHNKLFFSTQHDSNEKQSCSLLFFKTFMISGLEHVSVKQQRSALVTGICWQRVWKSNEKQKIQKAKKESDLRVNDIFDKISHVKTNTKQAIAAVTNSVSFFKVLLCTYCEMDLSHW